MWSMDMLEASHKPLTKCYTSLLLYTLRLIFWCWLYFVFPIAFFYFLLVFCISYCILYFLFVFSIFRSATCSSSCIPKRNIYVRSGFGQVMLGNKQEKFFRKLSRHENINCRRSQKKNDGINLWSTSNVIKKKINVKGNSFYQIFIPSYMDVMDIRRQCPKKSNIGKQFLILWCYMTPCRMAIYYHRGKLLLSKTEELWQHQRKANVFGRKVFAKCFTKCLQR